MFSRSLRTHRAAILLSLSSLLLIGGGTAAFSQTSAYSVTGWQYEGAAAGQVGNYTLGFNFTPTENIVISGLGEWVPNGDALVGEETVGIFDGSGNLLFSSPFSQANATVTGNTLPGGSQFRYVDITALFSEAARTLTANQSYTMAGTFINNPYSTNGTDLTSDSHIVITSVGLYDSGDTINAATPIPPAFEGGANMYGTNFIYGSIAPAAAATPEPGSIALFTGLAVTGGAFALRQRRKA